MSTVNMVIQCFTCGFKAVVPQGYENLEAHMAHTYLMLEKKPDPLLEGNWHRTAIEVSGINEMPGFETMSVEHCEIGRAMLAMSRDTRTMLKKKMVKILSEL